MPPRVIPRPFLPNNTPTCCFCQREADNKVPFGLADLLPIDGVPGLFFHEACAGYCPVVVRAKQGHGNIKSSTVLQEYTRGGSVVCSLCGQPGATLPCKDHRTCRHNYHLPCAREAASSRLQNRTFQEHCPIFSATTKEVVCPDHATLIEQPLDEPAGTWFEDIGGWDRQALTMMKPTINTNNIDVRGAHDNNNNGHPSSTIINNNTNNDGQQGKRLFSKKDVRMNPREAAVPLNSTKQQRNGRVVNASPLTNTKQHNHSHDDANNNNADNTNNNNGNDDDIAHDMDVDPTTTNTNKKIIVSRKRNTAAPPVTPPPTQPPSQKECERALRVFDIEGHAWELASCVELNNLPPLRPGEGRMLSVTMTAPVYAAARQCMADFLEAAAKDPKLRYVVAMQQVTEDFPAHSIDKIEKAVSRAVMRAFLEESKKRKRGDGLVLDVEAAEEAIANADWNKWMTEVMTIPSSSQNTTTNNNNNTTNKMVLLPEIMPTHSSLQIFRINRRDKRKALANDNNAMGVRVGKKQQRIPPYEVLGSYGGLSMFPEDASHFAKNSTFAQRLGFESFQELSTKVEVYSADFEHLFHVPLNEPTRKYLLKKENVEYVTPIPEATFAQEMCREQHTRDSTHWMFTTAYLYGNITSLINDPAINPTTHYETSDVVEPSNCNVVNCLIWGWPFQIVMNFSEIKPNKEILYSYGAGYWHLLKDRMEQEKRSLEELKRKDDEYKRNQEELKMMLQELKLEQERKKAEEMAKKDKKEEQYQAMMEMNKFLLAMLMHSNSTLPDHMKEMIAEKQAEFPDLDISMMMKEQQGKTGAAAGGGDGVADTSTVVVDNDNNNNKMMTAAAVSAAGIGVGGTTSAGGGITIGNNKGILIAASEDMDISSLSNTLKEGHGQHDDATIQVKSTKSTDSPPTTIIQEDNPLEEQSTMQSLIGEENGNSPEHSSENLDKKREAYLEKAKQALQRVKEAKELEFQKAVEQADKIFQNMDELGVRPKVKIGPIQLPRYNYSDNDSSDGDWDSEDDKNAVGAEVVSKPMDIDMNNEHGEIGGEPGMSKRQKKRAMAVADDEEELLGGLDLRFMGDKYKKKLLKQAREQQRLKRDNYHNHHNRGGGGRFDSGGGGNNNRNNNTTWRGNNTNGNTNGGGRFDGGGTKNNNTIATTMNGNIDLRNGYANSKKRRNNNNTHSEYHDDLRHQYDDRPKERGGNIYRRSSYGGEYDKSNGGGGGGRHGDRYNSMHRSGSRGSGDSRGGRHGDYR